MSDASLAQVRAFLAECRILTLATVGPDGRPHATDVYYAETDDLTLYFVSAPGSRHVANVAHNPGMAATIHADSTQWRDIRGLQLEGTCTRVAAAEGADAWARYIAKFPFVLADAALARALQKVDVYRITPQWLRWIDNTARLGHNQEWVIVDGTWQALVTPET